MPPAGGPRGRALPSIAIVAASCGLLAACGAPAQPPARPLRVSAAVSLTEALGAAVQEWERTGNPHVELNFAASNVIARQVLEGAPVDLFISADEAQAARIIAGGAAAEADSVPLLTNQLVVVTPAGRRLPGPLPESLADQAVKRIAIGDPQGVPAGVYAKAWLERADLWRRVEPKVVPSVSVRAALAAVEAENADAGIVYRTDARGDKTVTVAYEVPLADAPAIIYPAVLIKRSANRELASRFLAFLQSARAREQFAEAGFIARDSATAR